MEKDKELEMLKAKKLLELRKKLVSEKPKETTAREIVASRLVDRGIDVLEAAEQYYPKETVIVVGKLAELIKKDVVKGSISGGELMWLFRNLGIDVRVETKILIEEHGKLVSLKDKLKLEE